MLYQRPSFTVPANAGKQKDMEWVCTNHGHMEPDVRGKCLRCGTKLRYPIEEYS